MTTIRELEERYSHDVEAFNWGRLTPGEGWSASFPGHPAPRAVGNGPTRDAAIADLIAKLEEAQP